MSPKPREPKATAQVFTDRETIGGFVRARRQANRMTLKDLAELSGVGLRAVWELEHDKRTLRLDTANAVLKVFGKELGVVDARREPE